jgi:hypothetical protein
MRRLWHKALWLVGLRDGVKREPATDAKEFDRIAAEADEMMAERFGEEWWAENREAVGLAIAKQPELMPIEGFESAEEFADALEVATWKVLHGATPAEVLDATREHPAVLLHQAAEALERRLMPDMRDLIIAQLMAPGSALPPKEQPTNGNGHRGAHPVHANGNGGAPDARERPLNGSKPRTTNEGDPMTDYWDEIETPELTAEDVMNHYEPQLQQAREQIAYLAAHQHGLAALNETVAADYRERQQQRTDEFAKETERILQERYGDRWGAVKPLIARGLAERPDLVPQASFESYDPETAADAVEAAAAVIARASR